MMGRHTRNALLLLPLLAFAACGITQNPSSSLPSKSSITPGETITVDGSQNVYGVARAHNVSMRDIIVLNDLQAPYKLKPGQKLTLPAGGTSTFSANGIMPTPLAAPSGSIEAAPVSSLAPTSVQSEELAPPPPTKPASISKTGNGSPAVEALNTPTSSVTAQPLATTVAPSANAPAPPPSKPAVAASAPTPITPPPAASSDEVPSFTASWPVQGPVLSTFGPKGQGLNNDGINIGAPKGSPVLAAAPGIVVYAGNEMKGFGNLVLIRHQNKWVTAYAHLDRILVNKDVVVAQGDMIGTVGKTGNVPSPQLHFETRYDGKPVDPKSVIKSGT